MNAPIQAVQLDEDLRGLPRVRGEQAQRVRNAGGDVRTWEAWGRTFCAVSACLGTRAEGIFNELLASGWGRYSHSVAVWGWEKPSEVRGG